MLQDVPQKKACGPPGGPRNNTENQSSPLRPITSLYQKVRSSLCDTTVLRTEALAGQPSISAQLSVLNDSYARSGTHHKAGRPTR